MSILGVVFMWVWFVIAYQVVSRWDMGEESDRRQKYWARYEK